MGSISARGIALDKLLIGIITVSVISTAFWNYQIRNSEVWSDPLLDGRSDEKAKLALDDIKYHLVLAGYESGREKDNFKVKKGKQTDIISVKHNGVNVEYRVDENHNLIRKLESAEKVLAENILSLRLLKIADGSAVVTVTRSTLTQGNEKEMETLSKSYSIVVESNELLR